MFKEKVGLLKRDSLTLIMNNFYEMSLKSGQNLFPFLFFKENEVWMINMDRLGFFLAEKYDIEPYFNSKINVYFVKKEI